MSDMTAGNQDRDERQHTGARRRMVSLDDGLVRDAAAAIRLPDGPWPTTRETISFAVQQQLPVVVRRLLHAGLEPRPDAKRRPRMIDDHSWETLAEATDRLPLGQIELLRACLVLAARGNRRE
jgi:hypothetical protein